MKALETYMLVSRCWNNEKVAEIHRMSFERAIKLLRQARKEAREKRQKLLERRIEHLIMELVKKQMDNPEVEAAG